MGTGLWLVRTLFGRRWWWKTLVVMMAMAVMAGLGVWQLDRLEQRRSYNAQLQAKLAADPLVVDGRALSESPADLEDRRAVVRGRYDYEHQIALKNQTYQGQPGVNLVTPLVLEGSDRAILVNRGWVPYRLGTPDQWGQFDEQADGLLSGYLQTSRKMPDGSTSAIPDEFQPEWYRLDVEAIQTQMPYTLMPVTLALAPEEGRSLAALPVRVEPELDLSEGNHMSYAIQWFAFALIAGAVYVGLVRSQERERAALQSPPYELREQENQA